MDILLLIREEQVHNAIWQPVTMSFSGALSCVMLRLCLNPERDRGVHCPPCKISCLWAYLCDRWQQEDINCWLNASSTYVKALYIAQEANVNFAGRHWLRICSFWTHTILPHSLWDLLTSFIIQIVSRCWALWICVSPKTHSPGLQDWCNLGLQQTYFILCRLLKCYWNKILLTRFNNMLLSTWAAPFIWASQSCLQTIN